MINQPAINLDEQIKKTHEAIVMVKKAMDLADEQQRTGNFAGGRERTLFITKIEEAISWGENAIKKMESEIEKQKLGI